MGDQVLSNFSLLPLKQEILDNLEKLNFLTMTPIQEKSLPFILKGQDLIGQAKTGSGKTAAFALPILNGLIINDLSVQSLVLCPTRELAEQVSEEIRKFASLIKNIKVLTVCGGTPEYYQTKSLSHGAHIVVGTPGRVLKFLQGQILKLSHLKILVFDEADRMLDMGFMPDIREITSFAPKKRQTLLFSATFPLEIKELSHDLQISPIQIKVDLTHEADVIQQIFIEVQNSNQKEQALLTLLGHFQPESVLIFCHTKQNCQELAHFLLSHDIYAEALQGDLEQKERSRVLAKFSNKSCLVLVATDLAARGLDIKELPLVINYDLAIDSDTHTHRIGRTGRKGREGMALTLFDRNEEYKLHEIKKSFPEKNILEFTNDQDYRPRPVYSTMAISSGKKDKLRAGDILGALVKEAQIEAGAIGAITILDKTTYVAIESSQIKKAIKNLRVGKIKGLRCKVGEV